MKKLKTNPVMIRVHPEFAKRLKHRAIDEGANVVSLTRRIKDFDLYEDYKNEKKKKTPKFDFRL